MKKVVIAVLLFVAMALGSQVYANNIGGNDNDNTAIASSSSNVFNQSTNNNKNSSNSSSSIKNSGNSESNSSVKNSGNSNVRTSQGQLQGQIQGQSSNQANGQTTSIGGDKNTVYATSYPGVGAEVGTSSGTASSIFGSLAISDTEKYKQIEQIIQVINAEVAGGVLSKDDARAYITALNKKLFQSIKTKRILGVGPETSGKNLFNLMGLLSIDSFYKDGVKQGGDLNQVAIAVEETNKTEVKPADIQK